MGSMGIGRSSAWEGSDASTWQQRLGVPSVHIYSIIRSTNDVARQLAEAGAASLTIVVADHQTEGRGRAGRSWVSAPGASLLCSIVFQSAEGARFTPGAAPIRIGHAVAQAIATVTRVDALVKWPNDVVIPGRGKVAGVLCEATTRQGGAFVIGGIGVNVRVPGGGYASLEDASGIEISRGELLRAIINELRPYADSITLLLSETELARIRERDLLFGQQVVDDSGLVGTACGIAADGSLLVRSAQGVSAVHNATIRLAGSHDYPGARV